MEGFEDGEEQGFECVHIGDVFVTPSIQVEDEGIECNHVFTNSSYIYADVVNDHNADEATPITDAIDNCSNNKRKKLFGIGAFIIAVSIATATGVLLSERISTQRTIAAASLNTDINIPWYACLDKDSCFRQAKLLGFTNQDFRSGDYAYASLYGCFLKNRLVFWGEGGTDAQMIMTQFNGVQQRIWCYDVNTDPSIQVDICGEPIINPTGLPSSMPSTSLHPTISSMPSPFPTISLHPSISTQPTAAPSSSEPSGSPTISTRPSTSSQPSGLPSISAQPTAAPSGQPSSSPSR